MESTNFIQSEVVKNVGCVLSSTPGDKWLAIHLEYDFVATGKTSQLALESLERLILGQIHLDKKYGIEPLSDIPKWSDYD